MIEIELRLFGALREYSQGRTLSLNVAKGCTVSDLRRIVAARLKNEFVGFAHEGLLSESAFATEDRVLGESESIEADGTIAVLPPVCGG